MKKGVSERFDEHEQDTARRAYPREIVEGSMRTAQMPKLDLDAVRPESGTRPAITHDAIDRHLREKMAGAVGSPETPPTEAKRSAPSEIEIEADPHSRPTIEAGVFRSPSEMAIAQATPSVPAPPVWSPAPVHPAPTVPDARRPPIAGWVVAVVLGALVLLVSAASTVGFFLGRRSGGR